MPRTTSPRPYALLFLALGIAALFAGTGYVLLREIRAIPLDAPRSEVVSSDRVERGAVTRVVDGDTLHVLLGRDDVTIRLVGIDAPEKGTNPPECYSAEATDALRELADGQPVLFSLDAATDDRDKYGRLLRIVTVEGATRSVNEELVRNGAAEVYRRFPADLRPILEVAETVARAERRGRWGACP